ncbi:MAG: ABC transporter ATP-binding protein [Alphaproteobacteria bacterium]|nr:ABC transporter ATP-binding protein [Alphaproteobacteria bacterium]
MDCVLDIKNLSLAFRLGQYSFDVVKDISFTIPSGQTVALVGESGSGKSVIAQAIMNILPPNAKIIRGEIIFNGKKTKSLNILDQNPFGKRMLSIKGQDLSIIFQEPMTSLSPVHTIGDQISEVLFIHQKINYKAAKELCLSMLKMVGFKNPKQAFNRYTFELSGGLRQRAMIAMALICRPSLLIADEPTTALDVTIQAQILGLIRDLQKELNMAVLMITHDLGIVANMADNIVVLYHGTIMEKGSLDDIFYDPQHPYLKGLLKAIPRFHMGEGEKLIPLRAIRHKTVPESFIKKNTVAPSKQPLLEISNICKTYRYGHSLIRAVDDISFTLYQGECLGIVGESGCGKTTLSKIILRAISPDQGRIFMYEKGEKFDLLNVSSSLSFKLRRSMQFIFQDPFSSLNPRMTIGDILQEPLLIHQIGTAKSRKKLAKQLMEIVGLDPNYLNRYPHSFSGGQRQRIGIARALALNPDIILCDEPVSALDVSIQAQILNLLKELKKELGLTYLFISHNLAVVDYIADRILVMHAGRIVEMAPKHILFKNPIHPYTQTLLAAVPEPDPRYPLDFKRFKNSDYGNAENWPHPFTIKHGEDVPLIEIASHHFVRAHHAV